MIFPKKLWIILMAEWEVIISVEVCVIHMKVILVEEEEILIIIILEIHIIVVIIIWVIQIQEMTLILI